MRKSLDEIQLIEKYLLDRLNSQDRGDFESRLIIESDFQDKFHVQKEVYRIIRWFSRKQFKLELKLLDKKLFESPKYKKFQEEITNIFS